MGMGRGVKGPAPAPRPVLGGLLCRLRPAVLLGLPALLPGRLPGPAPLQRQAHGAGAPALQWVQPSARWEALGPRALPQLCRGVQLRPDAGLGPGPPDRRRGVRAAHEPGAHGGLRGGRGPAQHPARGLAHERAAAAAQLLALLPAGPRHALRGVGPGPQHGPRAGRPHLPRAAAAHPDVPGPAGVHLHRAHDGLLRPGLPERDRQEPEAVRLLPQHRLVHHDPCPGALRGDRGLRDGQRQLLQGEEPPLSALPLLREGPAGRVPDVPGPRAGAPQRPPLHHREGRVLPLGQEAAAGVRPPVLAGPVARAGRPRRLRRRPRPVRAAANR